MKSARESNRILCGECSQGKHHTDYPPVQSKSSLAILCIVASGGETAPGPYASYLLIAVAILPFHVEFCLRSYEYVRWESVRWYLRVLCIPPSEESS